MAHSPPQKTEPDSSQITRFRIARTITACVAAMLTVCAAPRTSDAQSVPASVCADWHAELWAIEGTVEVQRGESGNWNRVVRRDVLCFGDSVRTQAFSRVIVRLRDQSVTRLDEHSTLTLEEPDDGIGSLLKLLRGVIHVISRDPRALRFSTPYANAGLEGTEFDIRVSEEMRRTEIAVLEGAVVVTSPLGRIDVPSGSVGSAGEGEMPVARAIVEPIELMRWASYFPEIVDTELPSPDQEPQGAESGDASFFAARAAARLRRGNLETAEADIAASLRLAPGNSMGLALQAIVAVGRGDSRAAHEQAYAAAAAAPPTSAAAVSLSYVLEARGDLEGALASVMSVIATDPDNAIVWARRAQIELGRGHWDRSIESAMRAIDLRPDLGYARTVLGFVRLSAGDVARAIESFEQAAALDQGAPLPHIGLALALMQRGDLVLGRQELEVAVALDPANALTRSYMAKTYDAENRSKLPGSQLELAKRFDPNDPTPWLYDALLKLNRNRPIEALQDLLAAISRNDNRALFRSRLAMDADLATRSAGTGRVLRELGFEQLALVRGWAATAIDPTDYAAYRLLADVQSVSPRNEISRVSQLLTSQLLQPANLTPIQPQLGQASPLLASRMVPSELAFTELAPLVTANGLRIQASTVAGANDTFGEDVVFAGLRDRVSYSFGQFHYSTDGVRENNGFDQAIANAFVQFNPNERTSLQAELRSSEVERGDLSRYFDPTRYSSILRFEENVDRLRLGGRRNFGARDAFLFSMSTQDSAALANTGDFSLGVTDHSYAVDVQHIHEATRWNLRTGLLWAKQNQLEVSDFGGISAVREITQRQTSGYAYADVSVSRAVTLTAGASADGVDEALIEKDRLNPKIGVTWVPTDKLTVRAASFRTLQGSLTTSKQNPQPRLEPVHVAGFNQFPFGANGEESTVNGFAVDGKLSARMFIGAELSARVVNGSTVFYENDANPFAVPTEATEDIARTYLYWMPRQDISFGAQYQTERLSADDVARLRFSNIRTRRLPLEARYFGANGLNAGLRASHFDQHGEFLFVDPSGGETLGPGEDTFWIVDASVGFRLPNRRGVLSFNVDNLFDQEFRFQDLDPENPSVMPERTAYFRFTLSFD